MDRFEQGKVLDYLWHAMTGTHGRRLRRPRRELASWIVDNSDALGIAMPGVTVPEGGFGPFDSRISDELWEILQITLTTAHENPPKAEPSNLQQRLDWLGKTLNLGALDVEILGVVVRAALSRTVDSLVDEIAGERMVPDEINTTTIARLLAREQGVIRTRLRHNQPLLGYGLLEDRRGGDVAASGTLLQVARTPAGNEEKLRRVLFGRTQRAELSWDDFAHLGPERDLAERLMRAGLEKRGAQANILLYGPPGSGKTAFAKVLGERVGGQVRFVGETDEEGEPSRQSRIAAFILAQAMTGGEARMVLVVDEAEDIFFGFDEDLFERRRGSKVFLNRLVETNAAPTIWITNHPDRLGETVLRRMSLAIRMPDASPKVRERVVARSLKRHRLKVAEPDLRRLAAIDAPPALLETAIRVAKQTGGGADDIATSARSVLRVMQGREIVPYASQCTLPFDPALSAADTDLVALAERVVASPETALSFCFHGAPGTGKSAYARHLAERLGLEVIEKRASNLLSMYLGQSERLIARAFEEAADRRAMLILDEADSFLQDRSRAHRSWEVTQVNELLVQMERHRFPFVCTTNLMASLDPATLRRFLFKVKFLAMTPGQIAEAFRRAFGADAPRSVTTLDPLTPGDIAVVERKAKVLGLADTAQIAAWLVDEVAAKPAARTGTIGFLN